MNVFDSVILEAFQKNNERDPYEDMKIVVASLKRDDYNDFSIMENPKFFRKAVRYSYIQYDGELPVAFAYTREYRYEGNHTGVTISVAVNPEYRRRGYAKLCCEKVIQEAKSDPKITEIAWGADKTNKGSIALAKSLGFKSWYTHDGDIMLRIPM